MNNKSLKKLAFKAALALMLMLFAPFSAYAQIAVKGVVTDEFGEPVIGATARVQGTNNGTITDFDGNFSLTDVAEGANIEFSYVGYVQQLVPASANMSIVLVEDNKTLEDVVVVGYGVQKKKLLTGANLNVKGDDIAKLNTSTAMEALQGMAPGVTISRNNGKPGSGTKVVIRGQGTVGDSKPLYIVDGVAVGDIDYLGPSDIESIDVLKDAASAAIYGSRAANGVILVTTKKGKNDSKAMVSYDGYFGLQNVYRKLPTLNAQEYMAIINEGQLNDGKPIYDWATLLKTNAYLESVQPGLGQEYGQFILDKLNNGWTGTDWQDEMIKKNAQMQSHSVSITGGTGNAVYSFGFSYFDQEGMVGGDIINAGYRRLTARANTEIVLWKENDMDILKIGENFTYSNSRNKSVADGNIYWNDLHNALVALPFMPVYWDKSPDPNKFAPNLDGYEFSLTNPIASMYYGRNNQWGKGNNIAGNAYAELQPIKNLKIRTALGVNAWWSYSRSYDPKWQLGAQAVNTYDNTSMSNSMGADLTWTNTATYHFDIQDHSFDVLIGSEMMKKKLNWTLSANKQMNLFGKPEYGYLNNCKPENLSQIAASGADWAAQGGGLMSYMGRISYNYAGRYMADFTIRRDGSSNFSKDNRWGTFPSVSAGWNFSEEAFFEPFSNIVEYGKLRASWGQNGNQSIDNFIYNSNIGYLNMGYFFDGNNKNVSSDATAPTKVPNKDVTWETSEQLNLGLDLRFLQSRLGVNFDWYKKTTKDWLVVAPIQGTAGAGAPWVNGGDVENSGIEFAINWNDQISDFKYGVTVTGAHNKNEVTRLANAEGIMKGVDHVLAQGTTYVSRVEVGKPIGFFYGYKTDGVLQNQTEVDAYNAQAKQYSGNQDAVYYKGLRPGDMRYQDLNKDGVINDEDKTMIGKPQPDFELGLALNAEYKGVYVDINMSGKFGQQVMRSYRLFADKYKQNHTTEVFGRWHGEGTSNRLPRLSANSHEWNDNMMSDRYMYNTSYLRINNLTIGYNFSELCKKINHIEGARIYCSMQNLATITKYDGMDPDVAYWGNDGQKWASGIDLGLYPLPRTVMFGVNVTFGATSKK